MIRRINKLKNVGRFAELKSQGGNQHEFTKVNVIYALNACGKTTLCDVFRSLGTGKVDFILLGGSASVQRPPLKLKSFFTVRRQQRQCLPRRGGRT